MDHTKNLRKREIEGKVREHQVLESELRSLRKGAAVYKQQPNSHILFKADKKDLFSEAKKDLDDLVKEYEEIGGNPEHLKNPNQDST